MATPTLQPLTEGERAMYPSYTHSFVIDATLGNITQASSNTEQAFTAWTSKDQDRLAKVTFVVTEKFANTADTGYNTTTIRVGDVNDDDDYIVAAEMNTNGSVVDSGTNTGDAIPVTFTSALAIKITLGAQSGKVLNTLNQGRVVVLFDLFRPDVTLKLRPTGSENIIPS